MIKHSVLRYVLVIFLLSVALNPLLRAEKKTDSWKKWLQEVDIIMTGLERSVAKLLATEEEHERFQTLFWKSRDTTPTTPQNEYQMEFYRRMAYAKQNLHGVNSDRGRIYILLGKPTHLSTFSGYQELVECELWNYENTDKPGLLPFMNLVFFRPHDTGDYQLYMPGLHGPMDLLSPQTANRMRTIANAYKGIKMNSAELASASLSIVPNEGDPTGGTNINSSNLALNQIYSLPEREVEQSYIQSFQSPTGVVKVTHTTREIMGYGYLTVIPNQDIHFIHYALAAETLNLKPISPELFNAEIHLFISIEKLDGGIVFQDRQVIHFQADKTKKQNIQGRKVVFQNFVPVLEGEYNVVLTFFNNSTQEFFTYKSPVSVSSLPNSLALVLGYQLKEVRPASYLSFAADDYLVLVDPTRNFSQKDTLEGVVYSTQVPQVSLEKKAAHTAPIMLDIQPFGANRFLFRKSLQDVPDGTYFVQVKNPAGGNKSSIVHVLPFHMAVSRPFVMERPDPKTSWDNYLFVLAQQYLTAGNTGRSIEYFKRIPQTLWNAASKPIIAKAYYVANEYARVVELLEPEEVKKEYATLLMLANSSIALKRYPAALKYLQKIRQYGDTVEINNLLAATYLNMGDKHNAKTYYDRAKKIKDTPPKRKQKQIKKESNDE